MMLTQQATRAPWVDCEARGVPHQLVLDVATTKATGARWWRCVRCPVAIRRTV